VVAIAKIPGCSAAEMTEVPSASPFVKWAGGKRRLMAQYERFIPKTYRCYHEPFVGGGAFFFHLQPSLAVLSDINRRLIDTYQAIRDDLECVLERLAYHRQKHNKEYFYECREQFNKGDLLLKTDRAALMIYLNKTCFNGLYRENQKGYFNVPMGKYKSPSIFDPLNLAKVSGILQNVEIRLAGYQQVLERAVSGDFVYFDPPYAPLSATSNFTQYNKSGFGKEEQERLADIFGQLVRRGCYVMLSNSNSEHIRDLYSQWRIEEVSTARSINSKAKRRGKIKELLVMGY